MIRWLIVLVLLVPSLGAVAVVLTRQAQGRVAVLFTALTALLALLLLPFAAAQTALTLPLAGVAGAFVPDGLGIFLTVIAAVVGCLAVIFSLDYMRGEAQQGRYYALVLVFIASMSALVLTDSLLLLLICWEITAFCSYALISFHNEQAAAVAGGVRALVYTQLGGLGLLIGVLLLRAYAGTDQISAALALAHTLPPEILALVAFGFLLAAAAKSAQVPFHLWLPGAMEAPTPISALIHAATMVNAGVYLLARFYPAFADVPGWAATVLVIGLLSALLGAFMALVAGDLKRVLAYSTISQLGYMVYAVGAGAVFASQYHLLSHAVFKALLFLCAGVVIHATGTREMQRMGGLRRDMPFTHWMFVIGALALAGVPLLNGFWSKELILEAGVEHAPLWSAGVMLFTAGLTALYTLRMVWLVFYGSPRNVFHVHDAPPAMRVSLAVLALGTLSTWLLALPFGDLLHPTLPYHEIHVEADLFSTVLLAPVTWVALLLVALGGALWLARGGLRRFLPSLRPLTILASADFGFTWLSSGIVRVTHGTAELLRGTQTGQLNWNIALLLVGLLLVLALLALGSGV